MAELTLYCENGQRLKLFKGYADGGPKYVYAAVRRPERNIWDVVDPEVNGPATETPLYKAALRMVGKA